MTVSYIAPCGINLAHTHSRATGILFAVSGSFRVVFLATRWCSFLLRIRLTSVKQRYFQQNLNYTPITFVDFDCIWTSYLMLMSIQYVRRIVYYPRMRKTDMINRIIFIDLLSIKWCSTTFNSLFIRHQNEISIFPIKITNKKTTKHISYAYSTLIR